MIRRIQPWKVRDLEETDHLSRTERDRNEKKDLQKRRVNAKESRNI